LLQNLNILNVNILMELLHTLMIISMEIILLLIIHQFIRDVGRDRIYGFGKVLLCDLHVSNII
jgi:hypothetical protein